MPGEMDEIAAEFLVESYESLDRLDRDLLALERDPESRGACSRASSAPCTRSRAPAGSWASSSSNGSPMRRRASWRVSETGPWRSRRRPPACSGHGRRLAADPATIEVSGTDGDDDHDALVAELERLRMAPESVDPTTTTAAEAIPSPPRRRESARPRSAFTRHDGPGRRGLAGPADDPRRRTGARTQPPRRACGRPA